MKKKDFEAIGKRLLADLPGFAVRGPVVFIAPVRGVLRGLYFEGSDFDKNSFYVNIFILPLFVPTKFMYFLFGDRLRVDGADRWKADAPNMLAQLGATIKQEALPWLSRSKSLIDITRLAESHPNPKDLHVQQVVAYALARSGNVKQAVDALDRLLGLLSEEVPWQHEMAERAKVLKSQLLAEPTAAQRQLDSWEIETVRNLGLEEFR